MRKSFCALACVPCFLGLACQKEEGEVAKQFRATDKEIFGVEIEWDYGRVEIEQSVDDTLFASAEGCEVIFHREEKGILKMEGCKARKKESATPTLQVELPAGFDLDIETEGAQITLGIIQTRSIHVEAENGDICAEKITCTQGELDSKRGGIYIGELTAQNGLEMGTESGEVKVGFSKPTRADISTASGAVYLFLLAELGGKVSYSTQSGRLYTEKSYQKENKWYQFTGKEYCQMRVNTRSGDLYIE